MDDVTRQRLDAIVRARLDRTSDQIQYSLRQISAGNPLGSERSEERRVDRLALKTGFDRRQAEALSTSIRATAADIDRSNTMAKPTGGPEAIWGTADFIGVQFFARGRRAANAVGRVIFRNGRAQGTGFMVAPGLFLTNNHVIQSAAAAPAMCVQFDFEADEVGLDLSPSVFAFDTVRCFAFSPIDGLDFSLVAIGERIAGSKAIDDFGYLPLSDAADKHMLGEFANIIQHPEGRMKQIVLRDNNLVARDDTTKVLHYLADTQPGSSGSPVLNNEWEPIAIHHWGGPHLETRAVDGRQLRVDVNEGIRVSAIVAALRQGGNATDALARETIAATLRLWTSMTRKGPVLGVTDSESANRPLAAPLGPRANPDGSISWTFPIEISVRAPLMAPPAPPAVTPPAAATQNVAGSERGAKPVEEDYSDRGGYEPGFIPGFTVPLPDFSGVGYRIARNQRPNGEDDKFELRYHHFSIVMNAERRTPAFTACNIDGSRVKAINRQTKAVTDDPTLKQLDAESLGAESSDAFQPDHRVRDDEQMGRDFYEDQLVPGYDKPDFPGRDAPEEEKKAYARAMLERTARMLQKGHVIMRGDPAWGADEEALAAERDTFHYTNAAPQLGFFNQGSRDDHPGEKGKLRWRTVETYVLRNAVTTRKRICVFAGPVFRKDDPPYRFGSQLPLRFWKIAVWADGNALRSVAVIADQGEVLKKLTQGVPERIGPRLREEAFNDIEELNRVSQFLTTVAEIERLTGLDFGANVRRGDVRVADSDEPAGDVELSGSLRRRPRAVKPPPAAPTRRRPPRTGA